MSGDSGQGRSPPQTPEGSAAENETGKERQDLTPPVMVLPSPLLVDTLQILMPTTCMLLLAIQLAKLMTNSLHMRHMMVANPTVMNGVGHGCSTFKLSSNISRMLVSLHHNTIILEALSSPHLKTGDKHSVQIALDFAKDGFGDQHAAKTAIENYSVKAFEDMCWVAQSLSIRDAQHKDGLVFWGTGGSITKIPDIVRSAFAHCPIDQNPGLIDKYSTPIHQSHQFCISINDMNLLGKLTQASLANYGWLNDNNPHDAFAGIDDGNNSSGSEFQESNLRFMDDEDSNNVVKKQVQCAGCAKSGGSNGIAVDVSAIKEQLRNLQAQDTDIDPGLQDDTINHDENLQDGPLSLDQKKVSQALCGQYMMAVNWLAKDWGIRRTRILIEGGAVMPVLPTQKTLKDWNTRMKAEYAALFEGLDDNEAAAKKESLHAALHKK
ncbi:hypothetical protein BS47DRAFT_1366182 [Hydnum rufescens UP504]|uniref:Uncharacterized protein n=1 Tax=Hydnum rufescens UP504 TaxID=1448309 RepID=A0A9P6ALN0_9AGAM|nr:hypothetical protein BS47DRAFT_1366182 [Hydnum rufescens UP504]